MLLRYKIMELLAVEGPMQVINITNSLNKKYPDEKVTRNVVNTTIYNNWNKGEKLFKRVGYGRFDLLNSNKKDLKEEVLKKLINLMTGYQSKLKKMDINYDTRLFGVSFTKLEIEFIKKKISEGKK